MVDKGVGVNILAIHQLTGGHDGYSFYHIKRGRR